MNNVTLSYEFVPTGASAAVINGRVNGNVLPVPESLLQPLGLRVTSDTTPTTSTSVTREITLAFGPSTAATATATVVDGTVSAVAINTGAGIDYVVPPIVQFVGGGVGGLTPGSPEPFPEDPNHPDNQIAAGIIALAVAYMNLQGTTLVNGGGTYGGSTTIGFVGGLPPALFVNPQPITNKYAEANIASAPVANGPPYAVNAISVDINNQGYGYSADTVVQILGGEFTTQATAIISEFGPNGEIIEVQVTNSGSGYKTVPQIAFYDPMNPNSSEDEPQAIACALMGAGTPATATLTIVGGVITTVTITGAGSGYVALPTVVLHDPAGTGSAAVIVPRMGVSGFVVTRPGRGYQTAPTVNLVPYFKSIYPDTSDQADPFYFYMTNLLKTAANADCTTANPVLS